MNNNKYFGLNQEELEDMGDIESSLMSYGESKVKQIGEMTEKDKGEFIEKTADEIKNQFSGLIGLLNEDNEIDNMTDQSVINYKPYCSKYYQEKYPGFPEQIYSMLEASTEPENKVIDNRLANMIKKDIDSRPFSPNPYSSPLMEQIKSKQEFPDVSANYLQENKIDLENTENITIE